VYGLREHFYRAVYLGFSSLYLLCKSSVWCLVALCLGAVAAFNVCCITSVRSGSGNRVICGNFVAASIYDVVTC
jgi:hypothetical protein